MHWRTCLIGYQFVNPIPVFLTEKKLNGHTFAGLERIDRVPALFGNNGEG